MDDVGVIIIQLRDILFGTEVLVCSPDLIGALNIDDAREPCKLKLDRFLSVGGPQY